MNLTSEITIIPYLHGSIFFARYVRSLFLKQHYDCVAVDIPSVFQEHLKDAIDKLPFISAIAAKTISDSCFYFPVDPCDAAIEAVRQSLQNYKPYFCIGSPHIKAPGALPALPDPYAGTRLGFDLYSSLCLKAIGNPENGSIADLDGQFIASQIHELRTRFKKILILVHFRTFVRTVSHFFKEKTCNLKFDFQENCIISSGLVNPDHLYFALGELPFITGKYEKERHDIFAEPFNEIETIKDLFRETRDDYFDQKENIISLSPVRLQAALTFLRNITVMSERLMPSLLDIVESAKGVGGNAFAIRILKSARFYPYISVENNSKAIGIGIDQINVPEWGILNAINLFRDFEFQWRTISIKPDPSFERRNKYRFTWNPYGMCSHIPEDVRIERFNAYIRQKTIRILVEDFIRNEKFSSSIKDGIDIRETLRNWHTGDIYVKEIPPSKGKIDTVVIVFDDCNDEKYSHCTTWYAEHQQESTLSFYATDPFENLIGPGIAECNYGGLALLYPPRHIPNIFELSRNMELPNLATKLTLGALLFSNEHVVAYIAQKKPGAFLRNQASKYKKHLLWIPLNTFSNETLRRLRKFHILNGKTVRSWAGRFIGD
ncbi:MAG TPA: hypothetical protein VHP36_10135 [Chitinispirillaceae bacterium]|nr:hypothetical protein [Chitinispirillaceae bacterium]